MRPPSGEQFEIGYDGRCAVVVEVGGGLRSYTVDGRDVILGYGIEEMAGAGRGQVLLPWPNRLEDGAYEFDGVRYQLALTEPEHSNAIHGLVGWASWRARVQEPHRVVLEHVVHPQPGYPFSLEIGIEYELRVDGLAVRMTATNVGKATCPYGCGAHPYLTVGTETVDDIVLQIPARTALLSDARGIPTGAVAVDGTELDFRTARRIAETKVDNGYMDLERDAAGLCRVELTAHGGSSRVTLWVDETYPYLMVFTGDRPDVQRRGLAVEPMTCPPNAFRSGDDLIRLDPGASVTTTWGIATG